MISVEVTARFRACLRSLNLKREEAFSAMNAVAASWGQPHLHAGAGIRRLHPGVYECRCGRHARFVFVHAGDTLIFDFAGNHDQVQAYLRNR
jgi:hypothetical protein